MRIFFIILFTIRIVSAAETMCIDDAPSVVKTIIKTLSACKIDSFHATQEEIEMCISANWQGLDPDIVEALIVVTTQYILIKYGESL